MGHVIFALDTQVFIKISNVYRNLKGQMKLNACTEILVPVLASTHVAERVSGPMFKITMLGLFAISEPIVTS